MYRLDEVTDDGVDEMGQEVLDAFAEFAEEWDALPFAASRESTAFGELLTIHYVSAHPEEWDMDMEDLEVQEPVAYVANLSAPELSEFGHIGFICSGGGIVRTA